MINSKILKSLLNKVSQVPTCVSALSARVHKCLSAQVPEFLTCPSAVRVLSECPSALRVSKCPPSVQVPFECPSTWLPPISPLNAQTNFEKKSLCSIFEKKDELDPKKIMYLSVFYRMYQRSLTWETNHWNN